MKRTLIIAEAGVNHNGDIQVAKKLIDVAADAGADYVKFQTFKADQMVSRTAKKADYQLKNTDGNNSQLELIKQLELDERDHRELMDHCQRRGIKFLSTPFDNDSINLLESLGMDLYKIPSGEITNLVFLKKIASKKKPVILSTGMSTIGEIESALDILFKYGISRQQIIVLHCNTEYPTPMQDVNLKAMNTIASTFKIAVGYSDHTLGIEIPVAAVAMGAICIEKHFTLSRNMTGPDHSASLEPAELKEMIRCVRNVEKALGTGIKKPTDSEKKNIFLARKSIHTYQRMEKGHILGEADVIMKRPGDGISPMDINRILGKQLKKDMEKDSKIKWDDLI